jgi:hypothetical protein
MRLMATHLPFVSSRFLWFARSFVVPLSTFAHIDLEDSGSDIPQKVVPQVVKLRESQRDSSKTLSSADDVESDEEETGSDSSDGSDVDTDSSSVPTFKEGRSKRKTLRAKKPATSSSDVTSSSNSDSSSDEEDELPSVPKTKAKSTSTSDSSSSSDSDSDEDSKPPTTNKLKRKAASSSSSDSSSEGDTSGGSSSGSSSEDPNSAKKQSAVQAVARSSASSTSSSSQSEDELEETPALSATPDPEARATKKRRANEEGKPVIAATTAKTVAGDARGGKASRKPNAPFQRVNAHGVKYYDEKLKDNSFESRVCPVSLCY